jgi:hypothetical protein
MSVSASKIGCSTVDLRWWIYHVEQLTRYNLSFLIVSGIVLKLGPVQLIDPANPALELGRVDEKTG